jgi:site-specific DNA-methyltransferase (cytosine-N4-specific)
MPNFGEEWNMSFEILQGNALQVLHGMESESVQCCITSPPYYGLRSYNTPPQIWGNHNGCQHTWGNDLPALTKSFNNGKGGIFEGRTDKLEQGSQINERSSGNFCLSCNAWRGELGLEPTFQLFLDHLIEIFAEVRRVLKRDGTIFVNLGDSYSGSGKGPEGGISDGQTFRHLERLTKPNRQLPPKSLMNIPARFAIAMTDRLQMIQRNEIIWYKRACMPSSAKDRFTVDFEKIFMFAKSSRPVLWLNTQSGEWRDIKDEPPTYQTLGIDYFIDEKGEKRTYWQRRDYKFNQQLEPASEAGRIITLGDKSFSRGQANGVGVKPSGNGAADEYLVPENRNKRCVWDVPFEPSGSDHYAAYPTKLIEPMILAGTDAGDVVLDPFNGTATTGLVALRNQRRYIGIELQQKYIEISERRLREVQVNLFV